LGALKEPKITTPIKQPAAIIKNKYPINQDHKPNAQSELGSIGDFQGSMA
jgi:hypothetical protein